MAFDAATYEIDPLTLTTPRARLEYLRDFLRRLPEQRFSMRQPGRWSDAEVGECRSPACIGGWARALFRRQDSTVETVGVEALGLAFEQSTALFYPTQGMARGASAYDATPSEAATVLDHLIRTGEVDWSVARKVEA